MDKEEAVIERAIAHWPDVAPLLEAPRTEADYDRLVTYLDALNVRVGGDETHPLAALLTRVADLIAAYDQTHYPIAVMSGVDMLRSLMEDHGLRQADLPEIGGQSVVSEILAGKRTINARQARALGKRFALNPGAFLVEA